MSPFYITTPIYYVNALPHLGTFYTTVVADAMARYHRARGGNARVFFLTGLDEHGQKIERIARERGMEPQAYVDDIAGIFQGTWDRVGITYDAFVRTSRGATARDCTFIGSHRQSVAEMWQRMAKDIYPAEYEGMYCVGCEGWKSDDDIITEDGVKLCPIHRRPVEKVKETNYFFKLSAYADRLLALYEQPDFIRPEARRNEVASFVREGLRDLSVSRMSKSVGWGIPVPGDDAQTIYVWVDALINYLTALGGPGAVLPGQPSHELWTHAHHLIGKDILRFHAVYWPAMLMSAGLPLPKGIISHGFLTVKGQKISKSIAATKVDPNAIAEGFGGADDRRAYDPLRYFVLREYALGGDGDFTYEALLQRYESDLGNDLGNLLNRTISMVRRYIGADLPPQELRPGPTAIDLRKEAELAWETFRPSAALEATWRLIREFNLEIDREKPWVLAKDPGQAEPLRRVLAGCCEALRWAALLVAPAMPETSKEILRQLGRSEDEGSWPGEWRWPGGTLLDPTPVFPRIDPDQKAALIDRWTGPMTPAAPAAAPAPAAVPPIAFEDFTKLDLRAAKVVAAERVAKADKLLKLTVDLGADGQRTVVSGIATAYAPEAMVGKTVIYLANLAPRKIRGVESQGMILAAGDAEVLALSALDRDVPPGTPVR